MDLSFLKWIEHACFLLHAGSTVVYIDPFRLKGQKERADVIFITHSHYDHLSVEDIAKIAGPDTRIVIPRGSEAQLSGRNLLLVEPGKSYKVGDLAFETVAAYNTKPERLKFHPKANGWVGYVIDVNGTKVYHAGDTDLTNEMRRVKTGLALLPMGGTFTMGPEEAIEAANLIKAEKVAPMHYRSLLGRDGYRRAEEEFKKKVSNGIILEQAQDPYLSQ